MHNSAASGELLVTKHFQSLSGISSKHFLSCAGGSKFSLYSDKVAVEAISLGTNTGTLIGPQGSVLPSRNKVRLPFCDICKAMYGRIIEKCIGFCLTLKTNLDIIL